MKTKIIGLKDFRQNISKLWKEARDNNVKYIVMYHSEPILEVNPFKEEGDKEDWIDRMIVEKFADEIEEARQQVARGETISLEELSKELSLDEEI